jgi:hypothetical protein
MFRKAAREFAETKIAPKVAEMEETGEVSDEVVKALGEAEMMPNHRYLSRWITALWRTAGNSCRL